MSLKSLIWLGMLIGSTLGGLVPSLFGAGILSYWGVLTSGIGAIAGIYLAIKISGD